MSVDLFEFDLLMSPSVLFVCICRLILLMVWIVLVWCCWMFVWIGKCLTRSRVLSSTAFILFVFL